MSIRNAYSTKPLPDAVAELQAALSGTDTRLVLLFASPAYDPAALSRQMKDAFPSACVVGCSTAGEIAGGKMLTGSVTAMALDSEIVSGAAAVVVPNLSAGIDLSRAFEQLEHYFQTARSDWAMDKYLGLVFADGLSGAEERLIEKLGDSTDVFFIGGSAGDDLHFQATYVYAEGKSYRDSAVLVLLRIEHGFEILKTQSFLPMGKSLLATAVDEEQRTVIEFDHKPALVAYAEALGIPPEDAPAQFFDHPLGLMAHGEPFVRSPQRSDGRSIVFYCHIKEGMQLEVLEATDIVADTRRAVEKHKNGRREIRGLIDFQCILRTLQLRQEQRCEQYGEIFAGIPMVGFSTYGEAYLGHLNQTSTMLLFH